MGQVEDKTGNQGNDKDARRLVADVGFAFVERQIVSAKGAVLIGAVVAGQDDSAVEHLENNLFLVATVVAADFSTVNGVPSVASAVVVTVAVLLN